MINKKDKCVFSPLLLKKNQESYTVLNGKALIKLFESLL